MNRYTYINVLYQSSLLFAQIHISKSPIAQHCILLQPVTFPVMYLVRKLSVTVNVQQRSVKCWLQSMSIAEKLSCKFNWIRLYLFVKRSLQNLQYSYQVFFILRGHPKEKKIAFFVIYELL